MSSVVENNPSRCFFLYVTALCIGMYIVVMFVFLAFGYYICTRKKRKIYDNNNKKLQTNRCQPLLHIPEVHIYAHLEGLDRKSVV